MKFSRGSAEPDINPTNSTEWIKPSRTARHKTSV
jgi:hypothetical protein